MGEVDGGPRKYLLDLKTYVTAAVLPGQRLKKSFSASSADQDEFGSADSPTSVAAILGIA
jgi:hypothetical protein